MANKLSIFTEIFPVQLEALPDLTVYHLRVSGSISLDEIGAKLGYRFQTKFGKHWNWDREKKILITDFPQDESSINQALHEIWETSTEEDTLRSLEKIEVLPNNTVSVQGLVDFTARLINDDYSQEINKALAIYRREEKTYYVDLKCNLRGWTVDNQPAISVSLSSEIKYKGDLKKYITTYGDNGLEGLHVKDKTKSRFQSSMEITGIVGTLQENNTRSRLLAFRLSPNMKRLIEQAPDDELVVRLNDKYDYIASALEIQVWSADYARFKISEKLQIPVSERSEYITKVVSIIKNSGLIDRAYSTTTHPHLFLNKNDIGYDPKLKIGENQIVSSQSIFPSLKKFGVYKPTANKQIRIAILNTAPHTSLDHLRINLRKELGENLQYELIQATEKQVSQPSRKELESAIEEIAQENPDIILGIISKPDFDVVDWTPYDNFKHLTLKKGLQSQVVQPNNVNNQYIIGNVVLGILAKTGNLPYVLAEPISYADLVAGLDVARQKKRNRPGTMNSVGMARIYLANGEMMRYNIRETMLEGEIIPERVLHDIFPQKEFADKKILIHRDGILPESEKNTLTDWGKQIGATFYFVEVIKSGLPRLYAFENKEIIKTPKGNIFKLSETEALLVSSEFSARFKATPQPIRVRTHHPFSLENALHSVLSLTLLHYGSLRPPRLPVTTHYADKISSMAVKGLRPETLDGEIPFWL